MKNLIKRSTKILPAAFGLLFVFSAQGQEDFRKIFASDYTNAVHFINNEKWIEPRIASFGLVPKEIIAIIFPELLRYNSIQDKIETFALESLYIRYGNEYADFSVGPLQVKPSFAEQLEKDFLKSETTIHALALRAADTLASEANRAQRLKRLKDTSIMIDYVCCFYKLLESRHDTWENLEVKIKFLAAAYNCGYHRPETEIKSFIGRKFFHVGWLATQRYAYADVSWYYYQHEN